MDFSLFVTFTKYIVGCPDDCTNPQQGTCDGSSGTCSCVLGFGGENCAGILLFHFVKDFLINLSNLCKASSNGEVIRAKTNLICY